MNQTLVNLSSTLPATKKLCKETCRLLDECKAENIVSIDLEGKSTMADFLIIASGRSQVHIKSLAEKLREHFHKAGLSKIPIEGLSQCDWVLVDGGDLIIHLFRPEVREFYNLEKMWEPAFGASAKKAL